MTYLFIVASLFLSSASFANSLSNVEVWGLGNDFFPMERDSKTKVLLSLGCEKQGRKCNALKVLREKKDYKLTDEDLAGGKNPGSVKCSKFLQGTVYILRNVQERENAFCKFKDGSLVSASSL